MVLNDFFTITDLHASEGKIRATLHINAAHPIFEGHFPGQPVVPGVTMMLMIRRLLETQLEDLQLQHADNVKFLVMINPEETTTVQADIMYSLNPEGRWKVTAKLFNEPTVYFKYAGTFLHKAV